MTNEVLYSYYDRLPDSCLTTGQERIEIIWNDDDQDGFVWSVHRQQRLPRHFSKIASSREETVKYAESVRREIEAREAERDEILSDDFGFRVWLASARKIAPDADETALRAIYETPMSHRQRRQALADIA